MANVSTWLRVLNELRKNYTGPWNSHARNIVVSAKDITSQNGFSDLPQLNYQNPGFLGNNASSGTPSKFIDSLGDWFENALTGERDFQRQVQLQQMQQDFNSAESAKAYERQLHMAQNSTLWQAEQLRQLGVNPAWAIAGGGGSSPTVTTAPTATSQAGNASPSGSQFGGALNTLGQLVITAARLAVQANSPTIKGVFIPKK